MPVRYDVIVLGAGPTGEHFADRAHRAGFSVAIVEEELVGGECSYWACIPSKTLLRPTHVLAEVLTVPGAREAVTRGVDVDAALARRNWMTSDWHDDGQVTWLDGVGVSLVRGHGRISGPKRIEVAGPDGTVELEANRAVVIAVGSTASVPPIDGLAEARPWTNREITSAKQVPRRLAVIGGGPVGVEMAHAWRRLGAEEVVVIEAGERLIEHSEPFASEELQAAFEAEGIVVRTGVAVTAVHRDGTDGPVSISLAGGDTIESDEVLVATGRHPHTTDIGLETVGLEPGRPVPVNDRLEAVGVEGGWLYAIGDANGRVLLTHMGKYQGRVVADVLRGGSMTAESDHGAISSVVFTDPQVASVGLTEAQARSAGYDVRLLRVDLGGVAASSIFGDGLKGTCQLVVDRADGIIVGATFVGGPVGEMLHAATIAVAGKVPMERLRHAVAAFPTLSEIWLELVDQYEWSKP